MRYSKRSFWSKVTRQTADIGKSLLVKSFTLYNVMMDEKTPYWAKSTIAGALAYLIFPVDAIPDMLPVVGFTDDAATIAAAAATVAAHIRREHRQEAREQVAELL